jgi:hypothetical protein
MKKLSLAILLAVSVAQVAWAEESAFNLEKAMGAETYERAGISKLSSDERAALSEFVRTYVAGKQKDAAAVAAAEAVDRAVKERKVEAPQVIESNIVGTFKGYGPRTFFHLANGEVWKPTNDYIETYSPIENPKVVIYRNDMFGYKMVIQGGGTVRVKRVQQ